MRQRLRPAHSPEQLAHIYAAPHDSSRWRDHRVRVAVTLELARGYLHDNPGSVTSVADLSCGDATIARSLGADTVVLGDYAPGYDHHGPIEVTIHRIPTVDLFVCSETLEHVDDPDLVLAAIRAKTKRLVLSTPVDCWGDANVEHYWAWSAEHVEGMLRTAGFDVDVFTRLDMRRWSPYAFGIWACS